MTSHQVADVRRKKRRMHNAIRIANKFNKQFGWLIRASKGQGVVIDVPENSDTDWLKVFLQPGEPIEPPTSPPVQAYYTTPQGEKKDLRELPGYLELLAGLTPPKES